MTSESEIEMNIVNYEWTFRLDSRFKLNIQYSLETGFNIIYMHQLLDNSLVGLTNIFKILSKNLGKIIGRT